MNSSVETKYIREYLLWGLVPIVLKREHLALVSRGGWGWGVGDCALSSESPTFSPLPSLLPHHPLNLHQRPFQWRCSVLRTMLMTLRLAREFIRRQHEPPTPLRRAEPIASIVLPAHGKEDYAPEITCLSINHAGTDSFSINCFKLFAEFRFILWIFL